MKLFVQIVYIVVSMPLMILIDILSIIGQVYTILYLAYETDTYKHIGCSIKYVLLNYYAIYTTKNKVAKIAKMFEWSKKHSQEWQRMMEAESWYLYANKE